MKLLSSPKLTLGLALCCLASVVYSLFLTFKDSVVAGPTLRVLGETSAKTGPTYKTGDDRYANIAFAFIKNYENNELDKSQDLMTDDFIFENAHSGSVIGNIEFIRMFKNYRKEFLKVEQQINSWVVLAPPYAGKGPVVHIWFKEILTRPNGQQSEGVFSEFFQFNEEGKITFLKLSND